MAVALSTPPAASAPKGLTPLSRANGLWRGGAAPASGSKRAPPHSEFWERSRLFSPKTPEVASFGLPGIQHYGIARTCRGGGVSILTRNGIQVETGPALVAGIELAQVTIHLDAGMKLTISSPYLPPAATKITPEDLDRLNNADGPQPIGADVNAHALAWDHEAPLDSRCSVVV
ncbi:Tbingi protein [Trypanosoma grayi]|uniref:Tbingi protein n=1 Tax=Trypanosoma grayi TaxID=71804 RepID=UPI0004F41060|nr:Tbingi protein [Trypanosoma grayi]KEG06318.1 Tbingi protein [Trypanosoma grayi]